LAGGQTVTVTYQVKVKPYAAQGDHKLDNFLAQTGHGIAAECVSADPLCTDNPVPPPAQPPLAQTGTNPQLQLALAGLLLGAGALLTIAGYRRRRS
jgi:LPXTG-motif cell wall-anchored protein